MDVIRSIVIVFKNYMMKLPRAWRLLARFLIIIGIGLIPPGMALISFGNICTGPETCPIDAFVELAITLPITVSLYIFIVFLGMIAFDFTDWIKYTKKVCTYEVFKDYVALKKKCGIGISDYICEHDMDTMAISLVKKASKKLEAK